MLRRMEVETAHLISVTGDALTSWAYEVKTIAEDAIKTFSARPSYTTVVTTTIPNEFKFQTLLSQWHDEAGYTSSITKIVMCPSYQKIIGMGSDAIPLILRQMESEGDDPDHWSWALRSITGENPIPNEAAGDTVKIAEAWLSWGRTRYAW